MESLSYLASPLSCFPIDAELFYNYYESIGWIVGKSPMKDWKATIRTWEKREEESFY